MKAIASTSAIQEPVLPTTNGHINLFEDLEIVSQFPYFFVLRITLIPTSDRHGSCRQGFEEEDAS